MIAILRYRWYVIETTDRRNDTRSRIIEVAADLLREQGEAAVTTRGVAEGAGVQAPMIYRLFGDKDGLLNAVAEHVMATYVSAKAAIVQAATDGGVDPLDELHAGWQMQIEFSMANPALFRLLSAPDRVLHSAAARSGRQVLESRVHRVALTGRLRVSEQRAVNLIQAAGVGAVQTLLATAIEQRDAGLAEHMYRAFLQQILTDTPTPPDAGPMATVVAFRALAPSLDMLTDGEQHLLGELLARVVDVLEREPR